MVTISNFDSQFFLIKSEVFCLECLEIIWDIIFSFLTLLFFFHRKAEAILDLCLQYWSNYITETREMNFSSQN